LTKSGKSFHKNTARRRAFIFATCLSFPIFLSDSVTADRNESRRTEHREEARNDRENRFKGPEKIRDRQQRTPKEFPEASDQVADN
jgi:hypothetical protein